MSVKSGSQDQPRSSAATAPFTAPDDTVLLEEALDALRHASDQVQRALASSVEHSTAGAEPTLERAARIFGAEVRALLGDVIPDDDTVRRAARQVLAEQAWEHRLGTFMDTADVVALLNVSRQHVNALAKDHRLIALKHDGRQRYPAWQFAATTPAQRACLAAAHHQLVADGDLSPWTAASWFLDAHPELDDVDPVAFVRDGGDCERVLTAARRDAAPAAQ